MTLPVFNLLNVGSAADFHGWNQQGAQQAHCPECKVSLGRLDVLHWSFCRYVQKQANLAQNSRQEPWMLDANRAANALPLPSVAERIRAAVEAEREACAKIVEDFGVLRTRSSLARKIRARGNQ